MIIEHPLARLFLLRDYGPIPRLIHFQYESEFSEAKYDERSNSFHCRFFF